MTCGAAESGTIIIGDNTGHIFILDTKIFNQSDESDTGRQDKRCKVFRGEVVDISIIMDASCKFGNSPRQYVIVMGDDFALSESAEISSATYMIKVWDDLLIFPVQICYLKLGSKDIFHL